MKKAEKIYLKKWLPLAMLALFVLSVAACSPSWHSSVYGGKHHKKKAPRASGKMGNWGD